MPSLNRISCSVELGSANLSLKEYLVTYSDGAVEAHIAVPEVALPFTIHVTAKDRGMTGLAAFVYIDGQYHCNRNRRSPSLPEDYIDLRLRAMERKKSDGNFIAREWCFAALRAAAGLSNGEAYSAENVGTIEVVILRCEYSTKPIAREPRRKTRISLAPKTGKTLEQGNAVENGDPLRLFGGMYLDGACMIDERNIDRSTAEGRHQHHSSRLQPIHSIPGQAYKALLGAQGARKFDFSKSHRNSLPRENNKATHLNLGTDGQYDWHEVGRGTAKVGGAGTQVSEKHTDSSVKNKAHTGNSQEKHSSIEAAADNDSERQNRDSNAWDTERKSETKSNHDWDQAKRVIKPYWANAFRPQTTHPWEDSKRRGLREAYIYPAQPAPMLPRDADRGVSMGVQVGRGADYTHAVESPIYLDTFENPHAVFAFKYRAKEELEKILNRKLDDDFNEIQRRAMKQKYLEMSRSELIGELMQPDRRVASVLSLYDNASDLRCKHNDVMDIRSSVSVSKEKGGKEGWHHRHPAPCIDRNGTGGWEDDTKGSRVEGQKTGSHAKRTHQDDANDSKWTGHRPDNTRHSPRRNQPERSSSPTQDARGPRKHRKGSSRTASSGKVSARRSTSTIEHFATDKTLRDTQPRNDRDGLRTGAHSSVGKVAKTRSASPAPAWKADDGDGKTAGGVQW